MGVPPTSVGLRLVYLCPSLHAEGSLGIKPHRDVNAAAHGGASRAMVWDVTVATMLAALGSN